MKGREWYQKEKTAKKYEKERFSRGGKIIDRVEKQSLFDILGNLKDKKILEIACGTGRFSAELSERGAETVGIDVSLPMLKRAMERKYTKIELSSDTKELTRKTTDTPRKNYNKEENMELIRGDASSLPFYDHSFDVTVAVRFFHLINNPEVYLKEATRVSPIIVFDTFNKRSARLLYNRFLPMESSLYSEKEVKEFIKKADLEIVEKKDEFFFPFGLYRTLPKKIAKKFRRMDRSLQEDSSLCSVSYWKARRK